MTTREIVVDVPRALWLSSNQRLHWRSEADRVQGLRSLGLVTGRNARVALGRTLVTAHIGYPPNVSKADPENAHPTTKALIDGFTDAEIWPDDDSRYVVSGGHRRDEGSGKPGWYRVRFELEAIGGRAL
ncbi:hypothetical protein [Georgenia sp. MJ170]|uniref:hypothetical protein n=1 Tax=Georgenia sunbinii TaxID=3117728 RepID=UPI002F25FEAB